ncbi:unnamed protein product [Rotaria sordida]|uniref:t-SNARE coiled-coil homology domain-containing protein n=1 Tax=Rotaria sordida TaxID=392033 RepID=A0A819FDA5_9BILA|nr:unnamed protein product [Rotaria sordida]
MRRQIANIIALPLIPPTEIDNSMEKIIDELCNYDSELDKLTNYVIKNYVEDARFAFQMWNHFNNIGIRPRTNNHLEGYHRQLNPRVRTEPDLLAWINEARSSGKSVMYRYEQEQAQKRTTRRRKGRLIQDDNKLMYAEKKYVQDKDFGAYQKTLRSISHHYIHIIKDAKDSSDEKQHPWPRVAYKKISRQHRSHEWQHTTSECSIPLNPNDADREHTVTEFLAQIDLIRLLIHKIRELTEDVKRIHQEMIEPLSDPQLGQQLDDKTADIKNLARNISQKLQRLEQAHKNQHVNQGNAQWRMTESHIFNITKEFYDIMNKYNEEYCEHRDRSGSRKTDDELEEIIEKGFQGAHTFSIMVDTEQIRQTAIFIEERHRDIQKLEHSIEELHDMFADLALLVTTQREMIDNIHQNVSKAAEYVIPAVQAVEEAVKIKTK